QDVLDCWRRGLKLKEIVRATGLKARACDALLERHASEFDKAQRRQAQNQRSGANAKKFSDEELASAIRRVARTLGRTPSANDYDAVAAELGLPSAVLITNRLGWSNAVRAAGLRPLRSSRRAYRRRWTEET